MSWLTRPSYGSCAPVNPEAFEIATPIGNGREVPKSSKVGYTRGTLLAAAG